MPITALLLTAVVSNIWHMSKFVTVLFFVFFLFEGQVSFAVEGQSVEAFLTSCFKDYVTLTDQAGGTPPEQKALENSMKALKKACLSPRFLANWRKIIKTTGSDPVLLTQDTLVSWKDHARVKSLDPVKGSAKVVLGVGEEVYCLQVGLTRSGSAWKIDSSKLCAGD